MNGCTTIEVEDKRGKTIGTMKIEKVLEKSDLKNLNGFVMSDVGTDYFNRCSKMITVRTLQ